MGEFVELGECAEVFGSAGCGFAADVVGEGGDVDVQGADGVVLGGLDEVGVAAGAVWLEGKVEIAVRGAQVEGLDPGERFS